jgi:hypothetical protein
MQPWESRKKETPKRSVRQKLSLLADGITISAAACIVIYGSLVYEAARMVVVGPRPRK